MTVTQMEKGGNRKVASKMIRRLGHNLGHYIGTVITCRYTVPQTLADPGSYDQLVVRFEAALARTVSEHPLLQVGLANANSRKPAWTQLESIDFRHHVEWTVAESSAEFDRLRIKALQYHLDSEFTDLESKPGWRITVLHYRQADFLEVIYSWNHANSDGMGGKIFHQTLLKRLNETRGGEALSGFENRVLKLPAVADHFTPTQHQLTKFSLTTDFFLKTVWRECLPPVIASKRTTQATWAPIRLSPYKTRVQSFDIDQGSLGRVLAECRKHKTTLTGLFHALCLTSLASQLGENEARAFEASTALSMRRHLPSKPASHPWVEPNETIGNLVSAMPHPFNAELVAEVRCCLRDDASSPDGLLGEALKNTVWAVASEVRDAIEARLKLGVKNDLTGVMKFVADWRAQMKEQAQKPREQSWVVTNLGVLDGAAAAADGGEQGAGGGWSIDHSQFILSAEVPSAALMVSPIAIKGRDLVVSVSWQDCVMKPTFGEQFTANLERWMKQLSSTSS